MIKELSKAINSNQLSEVVDFLSTITTNSTINLSDPQLTPLLSSALEKSFVYVALSREGAEHAANTLRDCGLTVVCVTYQPDFPIYSDNSAPSELASGVARFRAGLADVLVITAGCLLSCIPRGNSGVLELPIGGKANVKEVASSLEKFGYSRVQTVAATGEFSVRGDVLDVWVEGDQNPTRIMFFGDEVEAVKRIDIQTFLSTEKLSSIKITPISNMSNISPELISKNLQNIKPKQDNIKQILKSLFTRLEKFESIGGVRWIQPFICEHESVLAALVNTAEVIVFDRPREVLEIIRTAEKQNANRFASLLEGGLLLPEHGKTFTNAEYIIKELEYYTCIGFQNIVGAHGTSRSSAARPLFESKKTISFKTLPVTNYFSAISVLIPDLVRCVGLGKHVLVFVGKSKALENYCISKGVEFTSMRDIPLEIKAGINIVYHACSLSFELPDAQTVIYSVAPPSKTTEENVFQKSTGTFVMPKVGEVVVHEHHGLGRYLGMKKLTLQDAERDYIVLQYDGGAFVYLPPEQTGLLSNYVGEPTRLNRIGGQDFANAKQRVRRRLRELSFKLSELYAKRSRAKANVYQVDPSVMAEFSRAFPHRLTADQEKAMRDIEEDMSSDKVMDRLICGDVGFGKTEVALHAAFRAIMAGYQVAMLAPTTILSVQHLNTAKARLEPFGVRVEVLNRFVPDSRAAEIIKDVASGKVDMLVGTHRLLSGDIKFRSLGLLILDEEQRFGVAHKEKIKRLKANIDVLTLSATPIPRTLNMALIGIRDISNITTAPVNRQPIITYVTEYSDELLKDAIHREIDRGGQVLILFNNVEKIETFVVRVRKLLEMGGMSRIPPVKVAFAHGQMSDKRLEETIAAVYNREIDVLVASTIIENGIDISTANTLIVIDADYLGVAQMHQLRGRVGRSTTQAFAYFTYSANKEVSELSRERLLAIQNYSGAGAGLNIAMRDLQLRGAGDLLGASQSGHMEQIGFDIYCKILAEVAEENRQEAEECRRNSEMCDSRSEDSADSTGLNLAQRPPQQENRTRGVEAGAEVVLDIALDAFISHQYIEHEDERMKVYRAISQIKTGADCDKILAHLGDLYGKIPPEVKNIVLVGYVRALAKGKGIRHIKWGKGSSCVVSFQDGENVKLSPNLGVLIEYLSKL